MLVFRFYLSISHPSTCTDGRRSWFLFVSFFHSLTFLCSSPPFKFLLLPPLSFPFFHRLLLQYAVPPCVSSLPSILPFFPVCLQRDFWKRDREGVRWRGGVGLYKSCSLQPPRSRKHHAETDRGTDTLTEHPNTLVGRDRNPLLSLTQVRKTCQEEQKWLDLWPLLSLSFPSFLPTFF